MTRIFISHSHSDETIADLLVDFLGEAIEVSKGDIRCTSDPNHGLDFSSASISDQLKNDLKNAGALIVLVTVDSLRSPWILFEVGSFWTTDKLVAPIVGPGLDFGDLPGPLKGYRSIRISDENAEDELNELVNQLHAKLTLPFTGITRRRKNKLKNFVTQFRSWESSIAEPDIGLKEQIEALQSKLQTAEQNYQQKLKEKEIIFQKEKQELEQINQKRQKSFQNQIQGLSDQLKQEKSQAKVIQQQLAESEAKNTELLESIAELQERQQSVAPSVAQKSEKDLKVFNFEILIVNSQGKVTQKATKQAQYFTDTLGNNIDLEMIYIPGGEFWMGTEDEEVERLNKIYETDRYNCEKPKHLVEIQPFYLGKYSITQAQWRVVATLPQIERELKSDPSEFKGNNRPVEQITWYDAVEYCARLSQLTKRDYRLPSEAEWEYACRAGTTTPFYFGETITSELANYKANNTYADEAEGQYRKATTPVGQFPPNAYGLYDMHGNAWEWCADTWYGNYKGAPTDGTAWIGDKNDNHSCLRGGSWIRNPGHCRSAYRLNGTRDSRLVNIGFSGFLRVAEDIFLTLNA